MEKKLKIAVIGAGIQGVCNALFLQKKGYQVTLFDKDEPGNLSASYGNAGHFSPYASYSTGFLPSPIPSRKRPLLKMSSCAACFATSAVCL